MARHVNPSIRQRSSRKTSTSKPSANGVSGSRSGCARAVLIIVSMLGCILAGSIGMGSPAWAQGDVSAGQKIFSTECSVCHSNVAGGSGLARHLPALSGARRDLFPGFDYSSALKSSGLVWNEATLASF